MKKCIVSFAAHGRENYNKALLRLIDSAKPHWDGDYMLYSKDGYADKWSDIPIELGNGSMPSCSLGIAEPHNIVPYQFKLVMIQKARDAGYDQILYIDSTIRLLKNPQPLLDQANKQGVVAFENLGHPLANWITDQALSQLGCGEPSSWSEEELGWLRKMPQVMACALIWDFTHPLASIVFEDWWKRSRDGITFMEGSSIRPEFKSSRHDQSCISFILNQRGIKFNPYGNLVYPPNDTDHTFGDDIYFVNKGI